MMRARRAWPWLAGALLLGLAAGTGLLWSKRTALAESLALRVLAARGVPASLRVARVDLGGLELTDLALGAAGEPELRVARAELVWSWRGLRARRLDHVELNGVRLHARLGEAGLELGALDALLEELVGPLRESDLEEAIAEVRDGMIPSTENLARWAFDRLAGRMPGTSRLVKVRLAESDALAAEFPTT